VAIFSTIFGNCVFLPDTESSLPGVWKETLRLLAAKVRISNITVLLIIEENGQKPVGCPRNNFLPFVLHLSEVQLICTKSQK
jgi:hypothetical protein